VASIKYNIKQLTVQQDFQPDILTDDEKVLVNSYDVNTLFNPAKNFIRLEVKSLDGTTIETYPNLIEFSLLQNAQTAGNVGANRGLGQSFISYLVRQDGKSRLPMLGDVQIAGLTKLEAEMNLEKAYAKYYVNPYVQVQIQNQRVFVFPGNGADAQVIELQNNNTTLLEAIARAGGIATRGRAKRVKIVRQTNEGKDVYQINLSTIGEGLKYTSMIMQANDIVYVEPVPEISQGVLNEVTPIVALLSSAFVIYLTINQLK